MKRNSKPFSVEIKKSRVQGQRHQLLPRRLFANFADEPAEVLQKEEPQAVTEPVVAPRILPSIVEPAWGRSEPDEPIRRRRSSGDADREQLEFNLTQAPSKDMKHAPPLVLAVAETMSQTANTNVAEADARPADGVQRDQGQPVRFNSRVPRKKSLEVFEPVTAFNPTLGPEPIPDAEMIAPTLATPSKEIECRLTKRQAAAVKLPRHERWKRRLHPASW
ncbi:hypothetical protein ACD578_27845 (plasmid) [Microvirga sp. RSM25]|uniref:hypothetical protein n=1 Tax=Microvirga sp. RSM25 TaxID=3273802 RepID=UPI00384EAA12